MDKKIHLCRPQKNDDTITEFKNTGQNFKISSGHDILTECKKAMSKTFKSDTPHAPRNKGIPEDTTG
jgi:hypothetical protein